MQIKIKRFDKSLPLPAYKTAGAVCVDLCARIDTVIEPHQVGYIPLNVAVEIPKNCWVTLIARGSTHKLGIMLVNGIGVGDTDFIGDGDEYTFPALNFTDKTVLIERGSRIAQIMVNKFEKMELNEVEHLGDTDRGGFGTTGVK